VCAAGGSGGVLTLALSDPYGSQGQKRAFERRAEVRNARADNDDILRFLFLLRDVRRRRERAHDNRHRDGDARIGIAPTIVSMQRQCIRQAGVSNAPEFSNATIMTLASED
jgi:hypothetical protein